MIPKRSVQLRPHHQARLQHLSTGGFCRGPSLSRLRLWVLNWTKKESSWLSYARKHSARTAVKSLRSRPSRSGKQQNQHACIQASRSVRSMATISMIRSMESSSEETISYYSAILASPKCATGECRSAERWAGQQLGTLAHSARQLEPSSTYS